MLVFKDFIYNKEKVPSFQAFGPTQQQFQWPLKETLLKFHLQWTKVWEEMKKSHKAISHTTTKKVHSARCLYFRK